MNTVKLSPPGPSSDTQVSVPSYIDPATGIETIDATAQRANAGMGLAIGVAAILAALYFLSTSD